MLAHQAVIRPAPAHKAMAALIPLALAMLAQAAQSAIPAMRMRLAAAILDHLTTAMLDLLETPAPLATPQHSAASMRPEVQAAARATVAQQAILAVQIPAQAATRMAVAAAQAVRLAVAAAQAAIRVALAATLVRLEQILAEGMEGRVDPVSPTPTRTTAPAVVQVALVAAAHPVLVAIPVHSITAIRVTQQMGRARQMATLVDQERLRLLLMDQWL